jgi:flagellar biosynthetic protein FliR
VTEAELLAALPNLAFHTVLLLSRLGACAMLLPGLGEADVPTPVRLGFALALVVLMLPALAPGLPSAPDTVTEALRLVGTEVLVGVWIGWLARLIMLATAIAGQAIGYLMGLSSMLAPDPALGAQNTAMARLIGFGAVVLVLASGLYALPLRAMVESYTLLPAGGPLPGGVVAETVVAAGAGSLELALRLVAPLLVFSVLMQVAIGLLARAAPQAQVFVLAAPAQTIGGLALLALLLPAMLAHWAEAARQAWSVLPGLG